MDKKWAVGLVPAAVLAAAAVVGAGRLDGPTRQVTTASAQMMTAVGVPPAGPAATDLSAPPAIPAVTVAGPAPVTGRPVALAIHQNQIDQNQIDQNQTGTAGPPPVHHLVRSSPYTAPPVPTVRPQSVDPLAGLEPLPEGWTASVHTIDVGGLSRSYLTVAPDSLSGSVPVVVLMHGVEMDSVGILNLTQLASRIGPAVILAPEGWQKSWNAGGCCGAAFRAGIDDVGFIRGALAQVLAANPATDASRVYAVGFSNGGRMAYRLACDMPGTFAGFVAAEAVPVQDCSAEQPLDVMIIAQQSDPLLTIDAGQPPKYADGSAEPTVAAVVSRQQTLDGCSGAETLSYAGNAEIHTWPCAAGHSLTYVWYPGGSHSWRSPSVATPGATEMVLSLLGGQRIGTGDQPGGPTS